MSSKPESNVCYSTSGAKLRR